MNYRVCPICSGCQIEESGESGIAGACASCRDSIIPKYVPLVQHPMYVRIFLKERM